MKRGSRVSMKIKMPARKDDMSYSLSPRSGFWWVRYLLRRDAGA
jgi:hypothetical protein